MNKLAKVAPVVIILACVASLLFAFKIGSGKATLQTLQNDKVQLVQNLDVARANLGKVQQQADTQVKAAQAATVQLKTDLADVKAQLGQKVAEVEKWQQQVATLGQQLENNKIKLASVEQSLVTAKETAKSSNLQGLEQMQKKLNAALDENKTLSEQLVTMRESIQRLKQPDNRCGTMVDLRGCVVSVNDDWQYVVLDVGEKQRVGVGSQYLVYRGTTLISKVQVTSVRPTTCIADILVNYSHYTPKPGDLLMTAAQ